MKAHSFHLSSPAVDEVYLHVRAVDLAIPRSNLPGINKEIARQGNRLTSGV
jgi:hypothetical protein